MSLDALLRIADDVEGHLTLHANYGRTSERYPAPDWTAHLIWIGTTPDGTRQPASAFASAATLTEAIDDLLNQLTPKDTP
jgi:hypothetical protein